MSDERPNGPPWVPTFIDVEAEFMKFVRMFGGGPLCDFVDMKEIPAGVLNADFYIPEGDVIIELKTLEKDGIDGETYARRVMQAYSHFGYSGSDYFGWLFRGEKMPPKVAQRVQNATVRPIIQAVHKANKQIRSTKNILERSKARGLILIANDNNFSFDLAGMMNVLARAFKSISDYHTDAIVYLTQNVFYDTGDGIAHNVWSPVYNIGNEEFSEFVNELGKRWHDYMETVQGDYVSREAGDDLFLKYAHAAPIKELRKH